VLKVFLVSTLVAILTCVLFLLGLNWETRGELPSLEKLQAIEPAVKTLILDRSGEVIHEFYVENRTPIPLDQIPPQLVNAVVASEDRNFFNHWGIDPLGIMRAFLKNVRAGRIKQGGSTISQLLARNLFLTHKRTLSRKLKELLITIKIERTYTKKEILEMFFNQIYFGDGNYGVAAAAKDFFGKTPAQLTLSECAMLVALQNSPKYHSPRRYPERARAVRNRVLKSMLETGVIDKKEYESALSEQVHVRPRGISSSGKAAYLVEMVRQYLDERYGSHEIYEGGLKVHTTIDLKLQEIAEEALDEQLRRIEEEHHYEPMVADTDSVGALYTELSPDAYTPYLQGALAALEPSTGRVLALVGGRDFSASNWNRATQARRQPGSAFKPFVYLTAIENGFRPSDILLDTPISFELPDGEVWEPRNFTEVFHGPVTLRYALEHSINVATIKLLQKIGPRKVVMNAHRLGIRTPLQPVLSMALGSEEVTLMDLVSAYTVFANGGVRCEPYFVSRIEDRDGRLLEENTTRAEAVISPEDAYMITNMMESVMDSGTGRDARRLGFKLPAAGKTGTTDEYTDAWFVGFTPSAAAGVWVGFDLKNSMGNKMTGARVALPIWTKFMIAATKGKENDVFPVPPGIVRIEICPDSGLLPTANCPHRVKEVFEKGTEPHEYCDIHSELSLIKAQTEDSFRSLDSNAWDDEVSPAEEEPSRLTPKKPQ